MESRQKRLAASSASAPVVSMQGVVKRFGAVTALDGVDFDVRAGEIHGLLGENGAGKTTLMNILYGLLSPDSGTIAIRGEPLRLRSPQDAVAHGIGMVHQHFMLVPTLTVAENMILGERGGPLVRKRRVKATAERILDSGERYGLGIDPNAKVWQLSVGQQQRAEILRALYRDARILILDEPTATLTPYETEQLLPRLRALADEGASVVFITHHLDEVLTWADRITVLRRGERVATLRPRETTTAGLARIMVGRDVSLKSLATSVSPTDVRPRRAEAGAAGATLLVSGLQARGNRGTAALRDVTFAAAAGEIVVIAGVEGNGQAELEEVLFGLRPATAGSILLEGRNIIGLSSPERLACGLGIIPSDRYRRGLIRELSVAENLVFDRIGEEPFATRLAVRRKAISRRARELIERFSIRVSRPEQSAGTLSGGNAQRVVLARTLDRGLRCLIAAQPTRGLDVGAMEFVWAQLDASRNAGLAVVLISTDLDEVLALADRCYVMYRGQLLASWPRPELDREKIGLALGGVVDPASSAPPPLLPAQQAVDYR